MTGTLDDETPHRGYDDTFGPTAVGATPADFYGFDMVVHRWDVARALGDDTSFTDAGMDAMEASVTLFGEHLYSEGVCRAAVPVPAGASRQERLLATLGAPPVAAADDLQLQRAGRCGRTRRPPLVARAWATIRPEHEQPL